MKRLGLSTSRTHISTQGTVKSTGQEVTVVLSPSSCDLLVSDELSDVTLSPSAEPASSKDSGKAFPVLSIQTHTYKGLIRTTRANT